MPDMDKEIEEKVREVVSRETDKLVVKVRQAAVEMLEKYVGPGRISPEDAGVFIGISYRQIYRWLGCRLSKLWLPQLKDIDSISAFIGRVEEIRAAWVEIVTGWKRPSADIKRVFYHPGLTAIIESDREIEDKVDLLTKRTVHLLVCEMRSRADAK
jgi:hypothetical protein